MGWRFCSFLPLLVRDVVSGWNWCCVHYAHLGSSVMGNKGSLAFGTVFSWEVGVSSLISY